MKKLLILLITFAVLGFGGYHLYFWAAPSISITNKTSLDIKQASVFMAKNRITFSSIPSQQSMRIYRGVRQVETMYRYEIEFENGEMLKGGCGKVLANEYFVHFVITPISSTEVECRTIE